MQKVSHENDLIFMRMNVQVTYFHTNIVTHKDSFCHRDKSKLGIGLFIHELSQEAFDFIKPTLESIFVAKPLNPLI